ncbi:hypothetical protein GCM10009754_86720 [Amycolatopsis minnesotensis]|uniref:Uncharacterized protein n=1 Tax=Amycolatopsis minnesotensis TaxID=337894 RepID=A0ABN2SWW0_9PSEU
MRRDMITSGGPVGRWLRSSGRYPAAAGCRSRVTIGWRFRYPIGGTEVIGCAIRGKLMRVTR